MIKPKVSVLMTAYNREKYISEAIESVLQSTFTDFELLVVDDGSTDRTIEIVENFVRKDSRITLHINEKNLGDYPNRNKAVSLAKGKYLRFLDSDDVIYPFTLEYMYELMESAPGAVLGLGRPANPDKPFPIKISPEEAYRDHFLKRGLLDCGPSGTILERERFISLGGFEEFRFVGDNATWLKIAACYPVLLMAQDLVWWRQHEGQEIALGVNNFNYLESGYRVAINALRSQKCPLNDSDRYYAINTLKRKQVRRILRTALIKGHPIISYKIFKTCGLSVQDLKHIF